jgi:hypothetical protein
MSTATLFKRTPKEQLEDEIDDTILKMRRAQLNGERRIWQRLDRKRRELAGKLARINQPDLL